MFKIEKVQRSALGVAIALTLAPVTSSADVYVWGSLGGTVDDPATCVSATSPDAAQVVFTMIQGNGAINFNSSTTDFATNGYGTLGFGEHTQTCGTMTFDTETGAGTAEIVGFYYAGDTMGNIAVANSVQLDLLPSGLADGNSTYMLANMLFDWNGNVGIPVSIVYDAQGILSEMDGTPASFSLTDDDLGTGNAAGADNPSIVQTGSSPFADTGAAPASDGSKFSTVVTLNQGPKPVAGTVYDTPKVSGVDGGGNTVCVEGADAVFTDNTGGGCMNVIPSADATQAIIADNFDNSSNNPTNPTGKSGDPMIDGPFGDFNANFSWDNMKLVSFTDTTAPMLTLNAHVSPSGTSVVTLVGGVDTYTEPGATCTDAAPVGSNIMVAAPSVSGPTATVETDADDIGSTYTLTYTCTDMSGNSTMTDRTVEVVGPNAVITLLQDGNGDVTPVTQECGIAYTDAGATCQDDPDGNIPIGGSGTTTSTFNVDTSGVDVDNESSYNAVWNCTDSDDNTNTVNRQVDVVDTAGPVITIPGGNSVTVETTDQPTYMLPTATVVDANGDCSPVPGNVVSTSGTINWTVAAGLDIVQSTIVYSATDSANSANTTNQNFSVTVQRAEPVITLNGNATVVLSTGATYTEEGMDIHDVQDTDAADVTTSGNNGELTWTINSNVNTAADGTYQVTYDATDSDGNPAAQVVRTVQVGSYAINSNFTMLNASGLNAGGGANDVTVIWNGTPANNDESDLNFDMQIISVGPTAFFGFPWRAHHIRTFGPGTYTFNSDNSTCSVTDLENTGCPGTGGALDISMTVAAGQIGAHMLFDYPADGSANVNIDVINVWDVNAQWNDPDGNLAVGDPGATARNDLYLEETTTPPATDALWLLVSTDINGDGNNGSPMKEAPFPGFYANFNVGPQSTGSGSVPCGPAQGCAAPDTVLGDDGLSLDILSLLAGLFSLLGLRRYQSRAAA